MFGGYHGLVHIIGSFMSCMLWTAGGCRAKECKVLKGCSAVPAKACTPFPECFFQSPQCVYADARDGSKCSTCGPVAAGCACYGGTCQPRLQPPSPPVCYCTGSGHDACYIIPPEADPCDCAYDDYTCLGAIIRCGCGSFDVQNPSQECQDEMYAGNFTAECY